VPIPSGHLSAKAEWQAAEREAVLWIQWSRTYEVRAGSEYATMAKGDYRDIGATIVTIVRPQRTSSKDFIWLFCQW
jgi:hypothetical protein